MLNEKYDYILHKTLDSEKNLITIYEGKYKFIAEKMKNNNSGFIYCFFEKEKILGYAHLSNNWIVITSVPVKEMFKEIKLQVAYMIIIILIGILLAINVAMKISKKISEPVIEATNFAVGIANGNLEERLELCSNDETRILFTSLNKAAENINVLITKLKHTQNNLLLQIKNLKKSEETISYLAYNNVITKLPNRNYLKNEMPGILNRMKNQNSNGILIHMDIDNFRYINDTLGHTKGDIYLRRVSKVLSQIIDTKKDLLCSIGEDSYVIFIKEMNSKTQIENISSEILKTISKPITVGKNRNLSTTSSMGIALYPEHGQDLETLLRCADTALNKAKDMGKNRCQIFNSEINMNMVRKIEIENKLRKAIENDELYLNYQPKYDTKSKKMTSMEALLRWKNTSIPNLNPSEFIPIAEENGQIIYIGEFVLKQACKQINLWIQKGLKPKNVAVNISGKQIQKIDIIKDIRRILEEEKIKTDLISFEITESVLMNNIELCINFIKQVKAIGINVYLDDFGSEYSSLNYLKKLPVDYIKIDKSFIDEIGLNKRDDLIVSSLINLAHDINLKVVAEGVETIEQFDLLKDFECDEIQGYFLSKPLNPNEIDKFLV